MLQVRVQRFTQGYRRFMEMVFGIGIGFAPPLLLFNSILYLTGASLAAWALNRNIDSQNELVQNDIGDYVTTWFLPIAIISCMVGLASVLAGVRHICLSRAETLASAAAASLIAWVLDLVSLGFAVKEVEISGGYRPGRLKVIEAFVIVLAILELLNFLLLHDASCGSVSVNNNFINQGNPACRQPSMFNHPSMYNQVGAPHAHHHHPQGSMMQQPMDL